MLGELDALTIENNAAREAYGYKVQAIQGISNASAISAAGSKAKQDSILGGVLQGVSSAAGGMGGGGGGGAAGGLRLQGQAKPLYGNTAFVKNM